MSEQKSLDPSQLLDSIMTGLTGRSLAIAAKTEESIETVRFMFHPWTPLPNISLQGRKYGVQHNVLQRMELIPLSTWKLPVILPRQGGFAFGGTTGGPFGAFPTGSVGSRVEHRLQFPIESVLNLILAYGSEGPNNIGMVELGSLKGDTDRVKAENILLFKAIMDPAQDVILEKMPEYLSETAPQLAEAACENGVKLMGRVIPMSPLAPEKSTVLLREINASITAATVAGKRILANTKSDLADAKIGQADVKRKLDDLDKWLLGQFPSFSMDSDVERAAQATAGVVDAIQKGNISGASMEQLVAMQQRTLEELAKSNKMNRQLAERLLAVPPPAPAGSGASAT
jgi:hypothetical protein